MHELSPTGHMTAEFRPLCFLVVKGWFLLFVGLSFPFGIWSLSEDQEMEHGQGKRDDSSLAGSFPSLTNLLTWTGLGLALQQH